MSEAAQKVSRFIWHFRFPLAGLCVLLSLVSATQLTSLAVSNSLEIWYPEDDPELLNYRHFQETYGNDEIVVAAIQSEDTFESDAGLELLATLTDEMLDVEGVA